MTPHQILLETLVTAPAPDTAFAVARVAALSASGEWAEVECDGRRFDAAVAAGCLVRPASGDAVLVFREGEAAFVLQVLRRESVGPATLALPGRGSLAVEGESLAFTARRRLSLKGDRLDLHGRSLALVAETATWLGKVLTAAVERFQVSARVHETSADTMVEKSLTRTAIVEQIDSLRAETRVVTIGGVASETAQSKVVAVANDLRMDGQRITMG